MPQKVSASHVSARKNKRVFRHRPLRVLHASYLIGEMVWSIAYLVNAFDLSVLTFRGSFNILLKRDRLDFGRMDYVHQSEYQ